MGQKIYLYKNQNQKQSTCTYLLRVLKQTIEKSI